MWISWAIGNLLAQTSKQASKQALQPSWINSECRWQASNPKALILQEHFECRMPEWRAPVEPQCGLLVSTHWTFFSMVEQSIMQLPHRFCALELTSNPPANWPDKTSEFVWPSLPSGSPTHRYCLRVARDHHYSSSRLTPTVLLISITCLIGQHNPSTCQDKKYKSR